MKEILINNGVKVIIDDEDYDLLKKYKWYSNNKGYVFRKEKGKTILLHRTILKVKQGEVVDHINGNPLDNKKENLRLCTRQQNTYNRVKGNKKTSSKYKGVSWYKRNSKWLAIIGHKGKLYWLGTYDTEEEAGLRYNEKAIELFGEFAKLNEIEVKDK